MQPKQSRNKCLACQKEVNRPHQIYCNHGCQQDHYYSIYIQKWLNGIEKGWFSFGKLSVRVRKYLLELRGEKCEQCGWQEKNPVTKRVPVEIHHVDGNFANTRPDNLKILCPNCHSLTPSFRCLNIGKGRQGRVGSVATAAVL